MKRVNLVPKVSTVPSYLPQLVGAVHRLPVIIWSPAVERHPVGRARVRPWLPTQPSLSGLCLCPTLPLLPRAPAQDLRDERMLRVQPSLQSGKQKDMLTFLSLETFPVQDYSNLLLQTPSQVPREYRVAERDERPPLPH